MVPWQSYRAIRMLVAGIVFGAGCSGGGDAGVGPRLASSVHPAAPSVQEAPAGGYVADPPAVLVRDQNDVPMGGVPVSFAVLSGGGLVEPSAAVTGTDGIARVVTWKLGAAGTNTLAATVSGLNPIVFTANAVDPCEPLTIALGAVVNSRLDGASCQLSSGEFVVYYRFEIAGMQGVRIRQSSTAVDSYILLLDDAGLVIAENDDASGTGSLNSELFALLPGGSYLIGATSWDTGEVGSFELRVEEVSTSVSSCRPYFTVRGISTTQSLSATDCDDAGFRTDIFLVFLEAGSPVTIAMASAELDAFLLLFDPGLSLVAENDNRAPGTTDARIIYTPAESGYYVIGASSALQGESGVYLLAVQ